MKYQRLTRAERYQIQALLKSGISNRQIAQVLERSPSTICRELKRNRTKRGCYMPVFAARTALARRRHVHPPYKIEGPLARRISAMLRKQWSPEQICGRLGRERISISHETIYQFIYRDFKSGGKIYLNCRRKRKYRRTRKATYNYKNKHKRENLPKFDTRPPIVDRRKRIGDLERDTVGGKPSCERLLTIVDRVTRYSKIKKIKGLDARYTHEATLEMVKNMPVRTITNDNGQEFSQYEDTSKVLNASIYFNDPYSSWQRGTNENTNGLIRQYFPKGTKFEEVSESSIKKVEKLLNNRPRKILGYKTPLEVQRKMSRGVALRQ